MFSYSATTTIKAPPEKIWRILTDAPNFPKWDPGIVRLEGTIAPGNKVVAHTKYSDRAFPAKVTEFTPSRKMMWVGGMPLGLFTGTRTFTLTPKGNDTTEFTLKEEYTGLLLPIFGKSVPNLTPVFEAFAAGLKAQAEKA